MIWNTNDATKKLNNFARATGHNEPISWDQSFVEQYGEQMNDPNFMKQLLYGKPSLKILGESTLSRLRRETKEFISNSRLN
jgi:hypothetical protein